VVRAISLLKEQQELLLSSPEGVRAALKTSIQCGELELAKDLFKAANAWRQINHECLFYTLDQVDETLFFSLLEAAVKNHNTDQSLEMIDFIFNQPSFLVKNILPVYYDRSFEYVFAKASEHNDGVILMGHLLTKWLELNQTMGNYQVGLKRSVCLFPLAYCMVVILCSTASFSASYFLAHLHTFRVLETMKFSLLPAVIFALQSSYERFNNKRWSDAVFSNYARDGHINAMSYLLSRPHNLSFPSPTSMIDAFRNLIANRFRRVQNISDVEQSLLRFSESRLTEDERQDARQQALTYTVSGRDDLNLNIVFFARWDSYRPSWDHIFAHDTGNEDIDSVRSRPMADIYRDLLARRYSKERGSNAEQDMLGRLARELPEAERQNAQQQARAQVFWDQNEVIADDLHLEIHRYANKVNNVVMEYLEQTMRKDVPEVNEQALKTRLHGLVEQIYQNESSFWQRVFSLTVNKNTDQLALAKKAVEHGWSLNTPRKLNLIFAYLDRHHPDRIHLWMKGFIGESIVAYKNKDDPTSCSNGIDERSETGLRGIDPKIDALFVPAEGEVLVKIFFRNLNFKEKPQGVAEELIKRKINLESTVHDVREAYQAFLEEELEKMKVKVSDHRVIVDALLESLENMYEEIIKPQIQLLIVKTP
jgi:5'(3')-deoxyribonucleotidase